MNLRLAVRNWVAMHLRSSRISLEYEAYRNLYYLQLICKSQGAPKPVIAIPFPVNGVATVILDLPHYQAYVR